MLRVEQVFEADGVQRAIKVPESARFVRFALSGTGQVEYSLASDADLVRGRAGWVKYAEGPAGALYGIAWLRARGTAGGRLVVDIDDETSTHNVEQAA